MTVKELLVTCAAAVATFETAFASHSEWDGKTGEVKIGASATWTMDDEDVAYINANISRITVSGTLILDNLSTWPVGTGGKTVPLFWSSSGTVIKKGNGTVTVVPYNYRTTGMLVIEEGEIYHATSYLWGDRSLKSKIWVKNGASLVQNVNATHGGAQLILEGTGIDGNGAYVADNAAAGAVSYLILSNDASVAFNTTRAILADVKTDYVERNPALMELNGYTLTIGGTAGTVTMQNVSVSGGGAIKFAAGAARTFKATGTTDLGSTKLIVEGDLTLTGGEWNDIEVLEGATLFLKPADENTTIAVNGNITGAGNVQIGADGTPAVGSVRFVGNNSYAGTTKMYGDADFMLALASGSAIPDFTKFTQVGGTIAPLVGYKDDGVTPRWTTAQVLSMAKDQAVSTMKLDVSDTTDFDSLMIDGATYASCFPTTGPVWGALGVGLGGYSFEGEFTSENPLSMEIDTGAIRLTGDAPINLGTVTVTCRSADVGGTLLLENAKDVQFAHSTITVGNPTTTTPRGTGTLIVSNSTLCATEVPLTDTLADTALWVGRYSQGVLRIEGDSVVSNRVLVGGGNSSAHNLSDNGVGAIYQRGGKLFPRRSPTSAIYYGSSIGVGGHGYYELTDDAYCEFAYNGSFGYVGSCVVMQYDGNVVLKGGTLYTGYYNYNSNHECTYYIRKGACDLGGNSCWLSYGAGTRTVLTLDGPEAKFSIRSSVSANQKNNNETVLNLNNGGELEAWYLSQKYPREESRKDYPLVVNFNGGILKHGSVKAYPDIFSNDTQPVNKVTVYEKGAVFNSYNELATGANANLLTTKGVNIDGASGNGIQSITLPEPLTDCIAAPRVIIECEGAYGATAVAEIDNRTATVTNILVTSHGWGYTPEGTTVRLRYGRYSNRFGTGSDTGYVLPAESIVIGPNTAGGLTKIGVGQLNVYGTNTWAQWTRVQEGTVKAMYDKSIPSGTYLTLANDATLDLNNVSEATFTGVDGTGGTVANGALKIVGEWTVSAKKFLDRETTAITGTLDLTDCTGITLTDTEVLDEAARQLKGLKLFTATTVVGLADVEISGVPKDWKVSKIGNGIRLSSEKGLVFVVR